MNGKQLKNSILQWAIQGKLVPQDPNDEPASVLLERIRQEKERLIKEKKIKRDKNASIIYRGEDNSYYEKFIATGEVKCIDEEIPFEVPNCWEWCKIKHLFSMQAGKNIKANELFDVKSDRYCYPCYGGNGLRGYVDHYNTEGKFVLIGRQGALCGNVKIGEGKFYATEHAVVTDGYGLTSLLWAYYFLMALNLNQYATATAQTRLAVSNIIEVLIPLPPRKEQKRIVIKLDEAISFVERYNDSQQKLDRLNAEININLRKSILQEAIQGCLVPQDPNDEPASVLLEKIQKEKQRLLKEGILKKDLVSSTIFKGDDNKYYEQVGGTSQQIETDYDFPNNWEVVRLAHICRLIDGEKREGNFVCLDAKYLRGKSAGNLTSEGKFVRTGDNIILVDGENSGEVFSVPCDGYMGSTFKQLWVSETMYLPYVLYFIEFYKDLLRNSKKGAAIPHLNKEIFYSLVIGFPPYKEQMRIAKQVELLIDKIKG